MLSVKNLVKTYYLDTKHKKKSKKVVALNNVSIDFPEKGMVFLLGKSGSGKSTLLNAIGGLDTFDSGEIIIKGKSSKNFKQSDFDSYRNTFIGFVFQDYNILEEFTIGKNLSLALELQGKKADKEVVEKLLKQVDLEGYYKRKPNQLSGGQKQRIAIARALIKEPEIIMADEPTGALDSNTGKQVMDTLKKLSKEKLVIVVSHDREFAEIYGDRVVELKDGKIISDQTKQEVESQKSKSGVSYLGDELVHIKKGQKLSVEDFEKISKMLLDKSHEEEILISFDKKTNDEIKKKSFITDDGNREVFKPTTQVVVKNYDPKKFKLIKSRLKYKDALKMGAGSLKHKPIRLVFTILLSFVAFCMFGLVDTLASFNQIDSLYETIHTENVEYLPVRKTIEIVDEEYDYTYDREVNLKETDINKLKSDLDTDFLPVYSADSYYDVSGLSTDPLAKRYYLYYETSSGIMAIDQTILNNLGFKLEGRLPTKENEICISKNVYDSILNNYKATSLSDLQKEGVEINVGNTDFNIVGVIDNGEDLSKYKTEDLTYSLQMSVYSMLESGFTNMFYVTQKTLQNFYDNGRVSLSYSKNEYRYSIESSDFDTPDNIDSTKMKTYMKNGYSIKNLKANEAVVSLSFLQGYIEDYTSDDVNFYKNYIDQNLSINFESYNDDVKFTLNIVGIFDVDNSYDWENNSYYYYNKDFIVSSSLKDQFKHYSYGFLKLNQNSQDRSLIKYLFDEKYSIKHASADIIYNFGSMFEVLSTSFLYVGIAMAVFAALMMMNFIATSISFKRREIGVLRAIGARGKDVFAIFFTESLIICIIDIILSIIGCGIACFFINRAVINAGLSVTLLMFGIRQILLIIAISLGTAFISSFFPVYRIAKKNPIDSINNR